MLNQYVVILKYINYIYFFNKGITIYIYKFKKRQRWSLEKLRKLLKNMYLLSRQIYF